MSSAGGAEGDGDGGGGGLAPGFRFHPTDEELVGYYLKRKVSGKPFRVDAISEIDLYKTEPWDLPGKSRIRSRDAEWYFFSALDRKYANRSRTNRATAAGYWKTTGKDRPVHRSSAASGSPIGMKKTLVFHLGRAPSGRRTNWVMHEYRLLDPQEGFVVCRIFQKRGPGPQNGAQYGAPLAEEDEWEECEPVVVKEESADGDLITDQDVEDQKAVRQELSNGVDGGLYGDEVDQKKSNVVLKDGYLDLEDFASSPGEIIHNYEDCGHEDLNYVNEYLADDDDRDGGDMFKELSETGEAADDGIVYFDATSEYPDECNRLSSSSGINSFLDSTIGIEDGPDLMDELMAYFDATESLKPSDIDNESGPSSSSNPSCPAPAVNSSPSSSSDEAGCSGSSPSSTSSAGKQSTSHNDDFHGGSDLPSSDIWEKALSKHLFNMLDVISPPPAFGDGQPIKGSQAIQPHSTTRASSSIRITAGIIQIYGGVGPGNGKNWSVQKNVGISLVLSYTEASMPKTAESFLLRRSFQLLFLSVLILTASFKIGLRMYTR